MNCGKLSQISVTSFQKKLEIVSELKKTVADRSKILILYNEIHWSKTTKTSGSFKMQSTRFNILSFTQPDYLINFVRNRCNQSDGFFQRFLKAGPREVYTKCNEIRQAVSQTKSVINIESILKNCSTELNTYHAIISSYWILSPN